MPYRVVNVRFEECDVYCARRKGSILGNPFTAKKYPGKAIDLYKDWIVDRIKHSDWRVIDELLRIHEMSLKKDEVTLGCWCKPKDCHVDVIVKLLTNERVIEILKERS